MLHRICWVCWAVGAILILLSRMDLVPPDVGWAGFYVASVAAVLTYLRQSPAAAPARSTILTRAMTEAKNHAYEQAVERFRRGETLFYEGLACRLDGTGVMALVAVASRPPAEMDKVQAIQDAERAVKELAALLTLAPEISNIVSDRTPIVSLVSEFGERGVLLCQVTADGQVEWKMPGKEEDRPL
jgi:hypothetical protein